MNRRESLRDSAGLAREVAKKVGGTSVPLSLVQGLKSLPLSSAARSGPTLARNPSGKADLSAQTCGPSAGPECVWSRTGSGKPRRWGSRRSV